MFHTRKYIIILLFSSLYLQSYGNGLITDTTTLLQIRVGLDHIYNYSFDSAEVTLDILQEEYPVHPMTSFFEGLIYYWKHYPLIPDTEGAAEFEQAMEESWERAHQMKKSGGHEIEAVFFDLMARSFIVLYFADNGRSSKAITHLRSIYRGILSGFEMQEEFNEFYFITGLYNYYREAYIEAYPIYKPVSIFFKKGDKEKGLEMLRHAASGTGFTQVEAAQFLALINIHFENNSDSALWYAGLLHRAFPENPYFHSKYAEMLMLDKKYEDGLVQIKHLLELDDYNKMKGCIFMGIYQEKKAGEPEVARMHYEKGLELAEAYGERANYSRAYAYIGLSRYYFDQGDDKKAREYNKKARHATSYEYVFED